MIWGLGHFRATGQDTQARARLGELSRIRAAKVPSWLIGRNVAGKRVDPGGRCASVLIARQSRRRRRRSFAFRQLAHRMAGQFDTPASAPVLSMTPGTPLRTAAVRSKP